LTVHDWPAGKSLSWKKQKLIVFFPAHQADRILSFGNNSQRSIDDAAKEGRVHSDASRADAVLDGTAEVAGSDSHLGPSQRKRRACHHLSNLSPPRHARMNPFSLLLAKNFFG
jgi:hypothetical protein